MVDRPILFSAPMIRALLDGRKVQTRRLLRPQPIADRRPTHFEPVGRCLRTGRRVWEANDLKGPMSGVFPGAPGCLETHAYTAHAGDRLWVRESWQLHARASDLCTVVYRATEGRSWTETHEQFPADHSRGLSPKPFQTGWRSSIHMPRWASRLTLLVTDVRVQRLQEISEEDALAEGVDSFAESLDRPGAWEGLSAADRIGMTQVLYGSARRAFQHLWEHLHGAEAWAANPWISATSFEVRKANIDAPEPAAEQPREVAHAS